MRVLWIEPGTVEAGSFCLEGTLPAGNPGAVDNP
jgi:hypothetical protein